MRCSDTFTFFVSEDEIKVYVALHSEIYTLLVAYIC